MAQAPDGGTLLQRAITVRKYQAAATWDQLHYDLFYSVLVGAALSLLLEGTTPYTELWARLVHGASGSNKDM